MKRDFDSKALVKVAEWADFAWQRPRRVDSRWRTDAKVGAKSVNAEKSSRFGGKRKMAAEVKKWKICRNSANFQSFGDLAV